MAKRHILPILLLVLLLGSAVGAHAAGGAYVDNFQISNNGKVVFSDNFDDGSIKDWTKTNDVAVICGKPNQPPCALFSNKQQFCASTAWHPLSIKDAGLIEMSMLVSITPRIEQYECAKKKMPAVLQITLYSGNTSASARTSIHMNPCEEGARIGLCMQKLGSGPTTNQPIIWPGRWTNVMMRMDSTAGMITIWVDGRMVRNAQYDPRQFKSLREVGICGSFGEGQLRKD